MVVLLLVGIVGLGAGIRLWQVGEIGFNSDEAVYAGQAASISDDPELKEIFPVFRAHPLLFQYMLAVVFKFLGTGDVLGRLLAVAVGLATIVLVYRLGALLYGVRAGLWAALIFAVIPYHVVVTRQVLLDGPMTLFSTAAMLTLAVFASTGRARWLHATGAMLGLTFLAKETGIILIAAVYIFLALTPQVRVRIRDLALSIVYMLLVILPYPLSFTLGGGTDTVKAFLVWQLFRRPNHEWTFYGLEVPPAMGLLVVLAAGAALWLLRGDRSWRETLLLSWVVVPVVFFQIWPVKGFQYLLPAAPSVAILAARLITGWRPARFLPRLSRTGWQAAVGLVLVISLVPKTWGSITGVSADRFLAGSGGVPGGREAGLWVRENVPEGATLMAIGPSMANIIQFYGHRRTFGISVSPNPLHRNPVYQPVINPDLQIRTGRIQYLVHDAFSAERSEFFSRGLLRYVDRYNGRVVHVETVDVTTERGTTVAKPIIVIYEVRP